MHQDPHRKELFDTWSQDYDRSVADQTEFPFIGYHAVLDTIVKKAQVEPQHTLLDVGVGTGNLSSRFPIPGSQICGIDFSQRMLEQAQKNLPDATLFRVDLLSPDWPVEMDGPYDRIVSAYTLHEFPDDLKITLLTRLAQDYLNKGGQIWVGDISFPDQNHYDRGRQRFSVLWDDDEFYWCARPAIASFETVGFQVEYWQVSICVGVYQLLWPGT